MMGSYDFIRSSMKFQLLSMISLFVQWMLWVCLCISWPVLINVDRFPLMFQRFLWASYVPKGFYDCSNLCKEWNISLINFQRSSANFLARLMVLLFVSIHFLRVSLYSKCISWATDLFCAYVNCDAGLTEPSDTSPYNIHMWFARGFQGARPSAEPTPGTKI